MKKIFIYLLAPLLLTTGCGLSSSVNDDNIVAGVDFTELFADASQSEIAAVKIDWSSRLPEAIDVVIEKTGAVLLGGKPATVKIVSHTVGGITHYGAIMAADGLDVRSTPVMVYSHGSDQGVSVDNEVLLVLSFFSGMAERFVYVIPSFRNEPLSFQGTTWQSEGPPSPWDWDVDDALSLLQVAYQIEPAADPDRVGVLGFSRGAAVGMLMAARSESIDRVIDFFGPTDFFAPFVQDVTREILLGDPRPLPGIDFLTEEFILPFKEGTISLEEIRLALVRRSAVLYVDKFNRLQIHHGTADQTVPVGQAERLIDAMLAAGKTQDQFQAFLYDGGSHNPLTLEGSLDRAKDFMFELVTEN